MRRHVGQRPVAEVPDPAPHERGELAAVGPVGARAEPEIPVESGRLGGRPLARPDLAGVARPAGPGMHFSHGADRAVLDPLDRLAMALGGAALVAHLRRDPCLLGDARHETRLTDVVGERLLAVDVLAGLHRGDRDERVQVIGRGDQDGVDRLLLLEHDPEVLVDRARVIRRLAGIVRFHFRLHRPAARLAAEVPARQVPLLGRIGQRDDLAVRLLEQGPGVGPALAAGADDRHVHLVARGDESGPAEDVPGHDGEGRRGRGGRLDETASAALCHRGVQVKKGCLAFASTPNDQLPTPKALPTPTPKAHWPDLARSRRSEAGRQSGCRGSTWELEVGSALEVGRW